MGVVRIAHGVSDDIKLGHLDSMRDWAHAKDIIRGIHLMMCQETPRNLALASGQSRSVRQFVEAAFDVIGVKIKYGFFFQIRPSVTSLDFALANDGIFHHRWQGQGVEETGYDASSNEIRIRVGPLPVETDVDQVLQGNARRAAEIRKWCPVISFKELVREMVHGDLSALARGNYGSKL